MRQRDVDDRLDKPSAGRSDPEQPAHDSDDIMNAQTSKTSTMTTSPATNDRIASSRVASRERARGRSGISAAEILRTVRACERAGKTVVSLSVAPDGGYQLKFGEPMGSPQELDLVKMAQENG